MPDEIREQVNYDLVFDARARHRRMPWWAYAHQVEECAHKVRVPGPIDRRTEVVVPPEIVPSAEFRGGIVLHNDPAIDGRKAWPWEHIRALVRRLPAGEVVLLGNPGPSVPGAVDLRGQTSLLQVAAIVRDCRCYVGIDSGLMWIAGSLGVPAVGIYGTEYIPAYDAIYPQNPRATYLQAEGPTGLISVESVAAAVIRRLDSR